MTRTVLIVDDDPDDRFLLVQDLEGNGYKTVTVGSGESALEAAAKHLPDVIILDVGLPGMDGWETLRRLQEAIATAGIPVVLLTGHDDSEDLIRGYSSGAAYFIPKPYKEEELLRGLQIALSHGARGRDDD